MYSWIYRIVLLRFYFHRLSRSCNLDNYLYETKRMKKKTQIECYFVVVGIYICLGVFYQFSYLMDFNFENETNIIFAKNLFLLTEVRQV